MNFCPECGSSGLQHRVPQGDNRPRYVCSDCGTIHYSNPKIVAGCLATWGEKLLLCQRAIEPRKGLWTLPAGFMENEESVEQAAARETLEEADARVDVSGLYGLYSIPRISQVYMIYRAELRDLDFGPGEESLAVELLGVDEIPWDDIAFRVITAVLNNYRQDLDSGRFQLHQGVIS
ncbi:MAG: NUDIX hydrolase [Gammaproteobacteria bacterium]